MKYALLNGVYVTATPHQKDAICPLCKSKVVAKCGVIKVHHWAHKKGNPCDSWREADSEWRHRWLEHFVDCDVEAIIENNGTRHFADIKTKNGTTVLLRRGRVKEAELRKMEDFFEGLVWIVDLSANKRAAIKLRNAFRDRTIHKVFKNAYRTFGGLGIGIPDEWSRNRYPVIFDFSGVEDVPQFISQYMWCLMPYEENSLVYDRFLLRYTKEKMLELLSVRELTSVIDVQRTVSQLNKDYLESTKSNRLLRQDWV